MEDEMTWDEFTTLLAGIGPETPLGAIVSIRSEKDPERIKTFTPEQKRIRNEWINKTAQNMDINEYHKAMAQLEAAFAGMSAMQNHNK